MREAGEAEWEVASGQDERPRLSVSVLFAVVHGERGGGLKHEDQRR